MAPRGVHSAFRCPRLRPPRPPPRGGRTPRHHARTRRRPSAHPHHLGRPRRTGTITPRARASARRRTHRGRGVPRLPQLAPHSLGLWPCRRGNPHGLRGRARPRHAARRAHRDAQPPVPVWRITVGRTPHGARHVGTANGRPARRGRLRLGAALRGPATASAHGFGARAHGVAGNLLLGHLPRRGLRLSRRTILARAAATRGTRTDRPTGQPHHAIRTGQLPR